MYSDMLIKIKNAQAARKRTLKVPYNAMDFRVAEVLAERGYLASVERKGKGYKRVIAILLNEAGKEIQGVQFISKPSRRLYVGYKEIRPVRQGFGTAVFSTPKGVVSGEEARKAKVGGEYLFNIW